VTPRGKTTLLGLLVVIPVAGMVLGSRVARRTEDALPAPAAQVAPEAWLPRYDLGGSVRTRVELPRPLREISGLALDASGRLFAHNDENATLYELDPTTGEIVGTIPIGERERGDYEGLAIVDDRFFMVTSDGALLEFRLPAGDAPADFRTVQTGLGRDCEVEGLAYDAATRALLLPCKTMRTGRDERLMVHAVPVATLVPEARARVALGAAELEAAGLRSGFHPSSIELHPRSGSLFLVSAQEEQLIEISRAGALLAVAQLNRGAHPQPEGIAFGSGLELWLADEGGDDAGTLTRYALPGGTP
jgi:uncharacterized protein YjiK